MSGLTPRRSLSKRFLLVLACSLTLSGLLASSASAQDEEPPRADTTTTLHCSSGAVVGAKLTCKVVVEDRSKKPNAPSGDVIFHHTGEGVFTDSEGDHTDKAVCELEREPPRLGRCQVSYTPTTLGSGHQTVSAEYQGDSLHERSNDSEEFELFIPVPTSTSVKCTPARMPLGGSSKCVGTVTDISAFPTTPVGPVAFEDVNGSFPIGAGCIVDPIDGKSASCELTYVPKKPGIDTVTARYVGFAQNFHAYLSSSDTTTVEVGNTTATTLSCAPADGVKPGATATCTATVEDTDAGPTTPGGTVRFEHDRAGSFSPETCALTGTGKRSSCQVKYTPTDRGFHKLTASYQGEAGHFTSKASSRLRVGERRFAAPGGTGADPCANPADPCSLFDAADFRGVDTTIQPGDEVVMLAGTYTDSAGDLGPTGVLLPEKELEIHGQAELPRPLIELLTESGLVTVSSGDVLSGIEIDSVAAPADLESLGIVENVIVRSSAPGAIACVQIAGVIRDSACLASGAGAAAAGTRPAPELGAPGASLRNVTAVATGDESHGLAYDLSQSGASLSVKFDAKATIAKGTAEDVFARNGVEAEVEVQLDHSDYASVLAEDGAIVTPAGAPTNVKAAPLLAADGIHQLIGSPTVDAGATDELSGEADLDGNVRVFGPAADIGVDELTNATVTAVSCKPATVNAGKPSTCTATVENVSPGTPGPTGVVSFSREGEGTGSFSDEGVCQLDETEGKLSCQVSYTPTTVGSGSHKVVASYEGDPTHDRSQGSTAVSVVNHVTKTTLSCAPSPVEIKASSHCKATVEDTVGGVATTPSGKVTFKSDSNGAFSPKECDLVTIDGKSASCTVDYTPAEVQSGSHKLTAAYASDALHASSSGQFSVKVSPEGRVTNTALSCSPNPVQVKGVSHCEATVVDTGPSGASAPSGDITFTSDSKGNFPISCILHPTGDGKSASCAVDYIPAEVQSGHHGLTATYLGDAVHGPSAGEFSLEVNPEGSENGTTTLLSCEPATAGVGSSVQCSARVDNTVLGASAPTGIVHFHTADLGAFSPADCTLQPAEDGKTASCLTRVKYTPSALGNGTHLLEGTYPGDGRHTSSTGSFSMKVVPPTGSAHGTKTTLSCTPGTVEVKHPSHCKATVEDTVGAAATSPTGKVAFASDSNGAFAAKECALAETGDGKSASCTVDYTPAAVGSGSHQLTAAYSSDAFHLSSSGETSLKVNVEGGGGEKDATKTTLACNPASLAVGDSSICTATVTDEAGTPSTPRGNVSFSHSNEGVFSPQASCVLIAAGDGKSATCQLTYIPTAVGAHQLTAVYLGDEAHISSEATSSLSVTAGGGNKDATKATLACVPSNLAVGGSSTCTATVTDEATSPSTPRGNFTFSHSNEGVFSPQASCALIAAGDGKSASCQLTYIPTAVGAHQLTALYSGDEAHTSSEATSSLSVSESGGGTKDQTKTALSCLPASLAVGGSSICTATVTDEAGSPSTPRGNVSFTHSNEGVFSPQASCALLASGDGKSASCQLIYIPTAAGAHGLTGLYSGDEAHRSSEATSSLSVTAGGGNKDATKATLACNPTSLAVGGSSTCTATVTDEAATPSTPRGNFTFSHSNEGVFSPQASCVLIAAGDGKSATCQLTYIPIATGAHQLTALYSGDEAHTSSEATSSLSATAGGGNKDATKATLVCNPASLAVGGSATCTATVTDQAGTPSTPRGNFTFSHSNEGVFSPQASCALIASGDGKTASCQLTYIPTSVGGHQLTALYSGDEAHVSSEATSSLSVTAGGGNKDATKATLACVPASLAAGGSSTCTATVTDEAGTPSTPRGNFTFSHSNEGVFSPQASCVLIATGDGKTASCQLAYIPTAVGAHQLTALYSGDEAHNQSEGVTALTVTSPGGDTHTTKATLDCAPASVEVSQLSHCAVTVEDTAATGATSPTGKVAFTTDSEGAFSAAECDLAATDAKSATCAVDYTPARRQSGHHVLTVAYRGDEAHAISSGQFSLGVTREGGSTKDATTTALSCQPAARATSEVSTCTATVTDTETGTVPSGKVEFESNEAGAFSDAAACVLSPSGGAEASCEVSYRPVLVGSGTHRIAAAYQGDAGHDPSTGSDEIAVTIESPEKSETVTTLTCVPAAVKTSEATTCTVLVNDESTTPTLPSGQVEFATNGVGAFSDAATCSLDVAGPHEAVCALTYTPIEVGSGRHKVFATYEADGTHRISQGTATVDVSAETPEKPLTRTTLECAPASRTIGELSTCTATVENAESGPSLPTGLVELASNGKGGFSSADCTLADAGNGKASCQVDYAPTEVGTGTHRIAATYAGDQDHRLSQGVDTIAVSAPGLDPTATTVVCAPSPMLSSGFAACTVTVTDTDATPSAPSGEVKFKARDGDVFSGEGACTLFSVGQDTARCDVIYEPIAGGPRQIVAAYQGDAGHAQSEGETPLVVLASNGGHHTETSLTCDPASVILGGHSICTVEVTDISPDKPKAPGGAVVFASEGPGTFSTGGCVLFAVGPAKARCQLIYNPAEVGPGSHQVVAIYPGEAGHEPSIASARIDVAPPNGGHATATTVACQPATVAIGASATCTVTVADTDATSPSIPQGGVIFRTDSAGTFDTGGCHLEAVGPGKSACSLHYAPIDVRSGSHEISAAYEGDAGQGGAASHEPSQASTPLAVTARPLPETHPTQVSVACGPNGLSLGASTTCTATVADTVIDPTEPTAPTGEVKFASDGPGGFSVVACGLTGAGPGKGSCQVTYNPSAVGSGKHKITAAYQGDGGHLQSAGETTLQVVAPAPPAATAPNTTIKKKPRRKTALRKAKFKFVSDQAGSTFQCKLDKKRYRPCRSPFKRKVRPGRHVFRVRAINPQGLADPTPAVFRWRVGRPR
jgi:hypothetical protein